MVTAQVQARQEMEAANRQLQAANEIKDEFLGLVSHELRTPLTTISGNAQILTRNTTLDDEARGQALADIAAAGARLQRIVDNLLHIARAEQGQALEDEPLIVVRVVARVINRHRERYPERHFELVEHGDRRPVTFSEPSLEQVIENLITNAEKYSPPEKPITIEIERDDAEVRIRVLDRGHGIAETELERIFEAFYRSSEGRGLVEGLGIGLAVCKRLVEAHGGRMWVERRPGGGSEFGIGLPAHADDETDG